MTQVRTPPPPDTLFPCIEVLGGDLAIEFFLALGGACVKFPTGGNGGPIDGAVAPMVGAERLIALGDALVVHHARIPVANKWRARALSSKGLSVAQIARRIRVSDVTEVRWLDGRVNPWPTIGTHKRASAR